MFALSSSVDDVCPISRFAEHGGAGPIFFRRLLDSSGFQAPVDFVDYTIHQHVGNEEIYFIVAGQPVVTVEADSRRLGAGSVSVVRNGESHELVNDTSDEVVILVVQVRCQL